MSDNEISFEDLAAGLRGWTRGGTAHEQAAVELLIWHETWLRRPDFKGACISQMALGLIARIDWEEAREFVDRGWAQRGQRTPAQAPAVAGGMAQRDRHSRQGRVLAPRRAPPWA
jgi:hypothetical protein